jgi:hypothetical protein
MVVLQNKDTHIYDLPIRVADIIQEYQLHNQVVITTNSEGICLDSADFYTTLDYICKQFGIPKNKITIETPNAEEWHPEYIIKNLPNHWIDRSKTFFNCNHDYTKKLNKTLGCFIGKPNWHRLILGTWIHKNFIEKSLLTFHYDKQQERHIIDSELTEISRNANIELSDVLTFINFCPLVLEEGFLNYTIGPPIHYNLLSKYQSIFLDMVVETYVAGKSFFPTEKTLRPIIAKTPFIIMGPQGYLSNLQRIGFRTFNRWWSEDYDKYNNYQRLLEIKKVLNFIFSLSESTLYQWLEEMNEVLTHNHDLLKKINGHSTILQ